MLAERMILARLSFITETRGLIPPEQVGFRERRLVGSNIGRLVQEIKNGQRKLKPYKRNNLRDDISVRYPSWQLLTSPGLMILLITAFSESEFLNLAYPDA